MSRASCSSSMDQAQDVASVSVGVCGSLDGGSQVVGSEMVDLGVGVLGRLEGLSMVLLSGLS